MSVSTRWSPPEIDFSTFPESDGLPMAENDRNRIQLIDLLMQAHQAFAPLGHYVSGNLLVYYDPHDGWKHLSPDVFVALAGGSALRESWKTWVEGKFPEVVLSCLAEHAAAGPWGEGGILCPAWGTGVFHLRPGGAVGAGVPGL